MAVDIDPLALAAAARNAALNQVELETAAVLPADYDVLLASDVPVRAGNRGLPLARESRAGVAWW